MKAKLVLGGLVSAVALIVVGGGTLVAGPAAATQPPRVSLAFFSGGHGANAHWSTKDPVSGLPVGVSKVVSLHNPLPTGNTYAGATVNGVKGMDMSSIYQLSFMIDTSAYMGAGAPRFSVILSDGVILYPSAGDCPLTKNTGWQTASFAGPDTCVIYGSTGGGPQTWDKWSSSLGDPTIESLFIVQDEGPAQAYLADVSVNGRLPQAS